MIQRPTIPMPRPVVPKSDNRIQPWDAAYQEAYASIRNGPQMVYVLDTGEYKCMLVSLWKVARPGTAVCMISKIDRGLRIQNPEV